MVDMNNPIVL